MDLTQKYTYTFPTKIRFGFGVIDELAPYLKEKGISSPLIVTDPICKELPFFQSILKDLRAHGVSPEVFADIHKNPVKSDVEKGAEAYRAAKCDAIIGIGGGAPLDVARAMALSVHHPLDLFDYEEKIGGDQKITESIPLFITVPTTSGTGSEVGRSAIISDDETKQKKILFSPRLLAQQVFADPGLTMDLPPAVTAATGIDALTHHLESFVARGCHPLCDGIALEGISLVWNNLEEATHRSDPEARAAMMIAALMGAVAFQKGLGIVHSLAHPLSTLHDTHHGLANGLMLTHGMRFNREVSRDRFQRIERMLGEKDLIQATEALCDRLGLPKRLSEIGVTEASVDPLSELAFADPCHQCNPRKVSQADFKQIYQEAL